MNIAPTKAEVVEATRQPAKGWPEKIRFWLLNTWEVYPILLIAALFRLYGAGYADFRDDQSSMWRLARDSVLHGILPASSNRSSVGILHGATTTYLMMIPALFTSDPIWGTITVGLFNVFGVLMTYIFVRRYFGRLTGALSATLYATTTVIVYYNRSIWQPNIVPPLAILLLFALFLGAVERRKGWLVFAAAMWGLLYETHESGLLMIALVAVAVVLASYRSIRWRDIVLSAVVLGVIFLPYFTWLYSSHFADISTLHTILKLPPIYDENSVYSGYNLLLSPYLVSSTTGIGDPRGILARAILRFPALNYLLRGVHFINPILAFGGGLILFLLLFRPTSSRPTESKLFGPETFLGASKRWIVDCYNDPSKRGYILLLVWQGVLPLLLWRTTTPLYSHYLTFLLPGSYILIALCCSKILELIRQYLPIWLPMMRPVVVTLVLLVLCTEMIGSTALIVDTVRGSYDGYQNYPGYYSDAVSTHNAAMEADQLAQQRHINHIYIATNYAVTQAMSYFSQEMKTPVTVFDNTQGLQCVVLPSPTAGPAVFLVAPYSPIDAVLRTYTNATLVAQPKRTSGDPFNLYIVESKPIAHPIAPAFANGASLQLIDPLASRISISGQDWIMTHWQTTVSRAPSWRVAYNYRFHNLFDGHEPSSVQPECTASQILSGEQILEFVAMPTNSVTPSKITVDVVDITSKPYVAHMGPLHFLTYNNYIDQQTQLHTTSGKISVDVPTGKKLASKT